MLRFQRRRREVLVHLPRAVQQCREGRHADVQGNRQTDRRPQGIAPADPVPEAEHVLRVDAELGHPAGIGGHRHEVARNVLLLTAVVEEPGARAGGVAQGLLGGEGLGHHDEQRRLRIDPVQHVGQRCAVHVGHEVHRQALVANRAQRFADHLRPEVGAADADVHDVGDRLAAVALPAAAAHPVGEAAHLVEHVAHPRHHVLAADQDGLVAACAQRPVQHRAVLGDVHRRAGEHLVARLLQPAGTGQGHQRIHRGGGDAVLGIVEEYPGGLDGEARGARRIVGEQAAQVGGLEFFPAGLQGKPFRAGGQRCSCRPQYPRMRYVAKGLLGSFQALHQFRPGHQGTRRRRARR